MKKKSTGILLLFFAAYVIYYILTYGSSVNRENYVGIDDTINGVSSRNVEDYSSITVSSNGCGIKYKFEMPYSFSVSQSLDRITLDIDYLTVLNKGYSHDKVSDPSNIGETVLSGQDYTVASHKITVIGSKYGTVDFKTAQEGPSLKNGVFSVAYLVPEDYLKRSPNYVAGNFETLIINFTLVKVGTESTCSFSGSNPTPPPDDNDPPNPSPPNPSPPNPRICTGVDVWNEAKGLCEPFYQYYIFPITVGVGSLIAFVLLNRRKKVAQGGMLQ